MVTNLIRGVTMRFVFLVFDDPKAVETLTPERAREYASAFRDYAQMLRDRGAYVDGAGLEDATTATVVRVGGGLVTDGPYAEATEQLGAFFHVECTDLDAALELARKMPVATDVRVEIRPTFG
jgi:hypothetical protein